MKPLRLVLGGFGPYAGEQVLDFRELEGRSLFLIHGPTGSGKSTILDALCFALYGVTSGGERDARDMRCHQADAARATQVVLDFSLGTETYRVERSPQQERPRKRGGGSRLQGPAAALWRRTGLTSDAEEGTVLAAQPSRVTEEIEKLLGFRSEQFRQVVILPQGQFQRLLAANSGEREEILEVLFGTEIYRRIEEALKSHARGLEDEIRDRRRVSDLILQQGGVSSAEELSARRGAAADRLRLCGEKVEALRREERAAEGKLREARVIDEKLRTLEETRAALGKLEARAGEMDAMRRRIDGARRAATIVGTASELERRRMESRQATQALDAERLRLDGARKALAVAESAERAEASREAERDALRREVHRLEQLAERVDAIAAGRKLLAEARAALASLEKARDEAAAAAEKNASSLSEARGSLESSAVLASQLESRRIRLEEARRQHAAGTRLGAVRSRLSGERKRQAEMLAREKEVSERLEGCRRSVEALERAWIEGQAASLARTLEPGKPCPVCGATDHPSPARAAADLPTETSLRQKREELRSIEAGREDVLRAERDQDRAVSALEAEETALVQGGATCDPASAARVVELEAQCREAEAASEGAATLRGQLTALETEDTALRARRAEVDERVQAARLLLEGHRSALEERERDVPEELRSPKLLAAAREDAASRLDRMERARKAAERAAAAARESVAGCAASAAALEKAVETAAARTADQERELARRIAEEGFEGEAGFLAARLENGEIQRLDGEMRRFQADLEAARQQAGSAALAAEGLARLDTPALQAAAEAARSRLEAALREEESERKDLGQIDAWLERLCAAAREQEEMEARYAVQGRIAEVAGGRNPKGITFQRFVLGSLLDDVLRAASGRLRAMSKQRFGLHRARERADQRTAGGLDLEVHDAYSGALRPVATLSGGETFLAALSLALGLADVVQAYSGGIHLQTIFVDEGFGSLDSEALDLALRALVDLEAGGRLVGIISHVAELKERIDARLEVSTDSRGSRARFVVP